MQVVPMPGESSSASKAPFAIELELNLNARCGNLVVLF